MKLELDSCQKFRQNLDKIYTKINMFRQNSDTIETNLDKFRKASQLH